MKNIHVLPTGKPSRLFKDDFGKLFYSINIDQEQDHFKPQNIYITSDEEINDKTKPCWCVNTIKNTWNKDLIYYQGAMPQYHFIGFKKIILTTDQDLIDDGVQAIDDEFLQWFVKNPSYKEVETFIFGFNDSIISHSKKYEIIIPKEEPKPFKDMFPMTEASLAEFKKNPIPMKKETLEEAMEKYPLINQRIGFKLGAKRQAERMYSEEEVWNICNELASYFIGGDTFDLQEWFEQLKNK